MTLFSFIVNITFIYVSFYLSYKAFEVYIGEEWNREENLYWGMSFVFVGAGFVIYLVHDLFHIETISKVAFLVHNSDMIAWSFQALALLKILRYANKKENLFLIKHFKCIRVLFLSGFALYIFLIPIFANQVAFYSHVPSLQIIGVEKLDILYELWNIALGTLILSVLYTLWELGVNTYSLFIGYLLIVVSEGVQVLHIIISHNQYNNPTLWLIEWWLALVGIVYVYLGVYNTIKNS